MFIAVGVIGELEFIFKVYVIVERHPEFWAKHIFHRRACVGTIRYAHGYEQRNVFMKVYVVGDSVHVRRFDEEFSGKSIGIEVPHVLEA